MLPTFLEPQQGGPQIRVFPLQTVEPDCLLPTTQVRLGRLCQLQKYLRMSGSRRGLFAGRCQPLHRKLMDGLQQAKSSFVVGVAHAVDQALVNERGDEIEDVRGVRRWSR